MAVSSSDEIEVVKKFLDAIPANPCRVKPHARYLCTLCARLNSSVYSDCEFAAESALPQMSTQTSTFSDFGISTEIEKAIDAVQIPESSDQTAYEPAPEDAAGYTNDVYSQEEAPEKAGTLFYEVTREAKDTIRQEDHAGVIISPAARGGPRFVEVYHNSYTDVEDIAEEDAGTLEESSMDDFYDKLLTEDVEIIKGALPAEENLVEFRETLPAPREAGSPIEKKELLEFIETPRKEEKFVEFVTVKNAQSVEQKEITEKPESRKEEFEDLAQLKTSSDTLSEELEKLTLEIESLEKKIKGAPGTPSAKQIDKEKKEIKQKEAPAEQEDAATMKREADEKKTELQQQLSAQTTQETEIPRAVKLANIKYPETFYDVYELEDMKKQDVDRLRKEKILLTNDLLYADLAALQKTTGIEKDVLNKMRAQAELIVVRGIGPQYAHILVNAGIESIEALSRQNPEELTKKINAYLSSAPKSLGMESVSVKKASRFIDEAKKVLKKLGNE